MDVVRALNRDEVDATALGVQTLEKVLELAADRYYNTGDAIISDACFDSLRELLETKDPTNKYLQGVGAPVAAAKRVTLPYPMRSMDKVKPGSIDLQAWQARYPGPLHRQRQAGRNLCNDLLHKVCVRLGCAHVPKGR